MLTGFAAIGSNDIDRTSKTGRFMARYEDRGVFAESKSKTRKWVSGLGDILEVGPGSGGSMARLLENGDRVIFVDASEYFARTASSGGGVGVLGTVTSLPFADSCFDAVLADRVFQHVDDFTASLKELHRVSRDGAVLSFSVPDHTSLQGDAPNHLWEKWFRIHNTPRVVVATPTVLTITDTVAPKLGWRIEETARFALNNRSLFADYTGLPQRFQLLCDAGLINENEATEMEEWWSSGGSMQMDIVAVRARKL